MQNNFVWTLGPTALHEMTATEIGRKIQTILLRL